MNCKSVIVADETGVDFHSEVRKSFASKTWATHSWLFAPRHPLKDMLGVGE